MQHNEKHMTNYRAPTKMKRLILLCMVAMTLGCSAPSDEKVETAMKIIKLCEPGSTATVRVYITYWGGAFETTCTWIKKADETDD